jgi:hypothetical protein
MINQVVRSEEELRKLIRKDLKKAGSQCAPTKKELDEQIKTFFEDEELAPKEYPTYVYVDFTFQYHGFDVDLLTTSNCLTKTELEEILEQF